MTDAMIDSSGSIPSLAPGSASGEGRSDGASGTYAPAADPGLPLVGQSERDLLQTIADRLGNLVNQQAQPNTVVTIPNPVGGPPIVGFYTTRQKLRVVKLVLTETAAGVVSLLIGATTYVFPFAAAGTVVLDFPLVIGRGTDIGVTSTAGTPGGYLIASTE